MSLLCIPRITDIYHTHSGKCTECVSSTAEIPIIWTCPTSQCLQQNLGNSLLSPQSHKRRTQRMSRMTTLFYCQTNGRWQSLSISASWLERLLWKYALCIPPVSLGKCSFYWAHWMDMLRFNNSSFLRCSSRFQFSPWMPHNVSNDFVLLRFPLFRGSWSRSSWALAAESGRSTKSWIWRKWASKRKGGEPCGRFWIVVCFRFQTISCWTAMSISPFP